MVFKLYGNFLQKINSGQAVVADAHNPSKGRQSQSSRRDGVYATNE